MINQSPNFNLVRLAAALVSVLFSLALILFFVHRVDEAKTKLRKEKEILTGYRSVVQKLSSVNKKKLDEEHSRLAKRLAPEDNHSLLISEITEYARKHGLTLRFENPLENERGSIKESELKPFFDQAPFQMVLEGSYAGIARFLDDLSRLQNGLIHVGQFSIRPSESHPPHLELSLHSFLLVENVHASEQKVQAPKGQARHKAKSRYELSKRNPFLKVERLSDKKLTLEGIVYDPNSPVALMDGEMKRVGDQVRGATIVEIKPDSVLFKKGEETLRVRLKQN